MLHASESQQMLDRLSGELEDLRTIARLHGLPTGSPDRLAGLPLRLSQDSRLRSDLAELVRSVQMRDPELGLSDVLSLVLVAVGGPTALTPQRDLTEAVDLTGSFLASLGGWPGSAVEPLIDIDNPPDHDPRLDLAAAAYTDSLEEKLTPRHEPPGEAVALAPSSAMEEMTDEPAADTAGSVTLAEITHALARLERGNLELRLHLDSIDQRICRMEPLLEAVPHTPESEEPLPPEPPQPSRSSDRGEAADRRGLTGNLVHRGSTSPDLPLPQPPHEIDPQDAIKEKRRISLTSNFLDPANSSLVQPLSRSEASPAAASAPNLTADLAHPRVSTPRRDRFAAARELPSNPADADPLYAPSAEEIAAASVPEALVSAEIAPQPVAYADLGTSTAKASSMQPSSAPYEPPPVAEPQGIPEEEPRPVKSAPERLQYPATDLPAANNDLSTARLSPGSLAFDREEEPSPRRRLPWIAGLIAASVIGAAGFLYLNGLPAAISGGVTGDHAAVATTDTPSTTSPDASSDSQQAVPPPNAAGAKSASGSAGRVLGARESFTPSESVERTTPPTFVPGGVMDGYLVSAPRPNYPRLANLVGLQGKITFEAMVSKAGEVEALKVLGGPQGLRESATEAVKQWQYRPFEVKGRPVEVRTIIRVDVGAHTGAPADQDPLR